MVRLSCTVVLAALLVASATTRPAPAATDEQIKAAVAAGVGFLKDKVKNPAPGAQGLVNGDHGIGPAALAGIALLESQLCDATDPSVQAVAAAVREASYGEGRTYQVALCLLFLDKLENPADVPLIQMLAVRLLAGQNARGGWTYKSVDTPGGGEIQALRDGLKTGLLANKAPNPDPDKPAAPPFHPVVLEYGKILMAKRAPDGNDDNSNTQFAIIAVWAARKHGVPTDDCLNAVSRRFRQTQYASGAWAYTTVPTDNPRGAMTCAGLLALATDVARFEEKRAARKAEQQNKAEAAPAPAAKGKDKADPPKKNDFFSSGPREEAVPKKEARPPLDPQVSRGLSAVAGFFVDSARSPGGLNDLYFLWSVERVGVVFDIKLLAPGVDWYEIGSNSLIRTQKKDGSWSAGAHPDEVNTAFAVLFLVKANPIKDLSARWQKEMGGTLTSRGSDATAPPPTSFNPSPSSKGGTQPLGMAPMKDPLATPAIPTVGSAPNTEGGRIGADLARRTGADFTATLERIRDAKGTDYTQALVTAVVRLEDERKKEARQALADRLTRMTSPTLRQMLKDPNLELRRGAALACGQKGKMEHVPDLIDRLTDEENLVARAAKAGLVALTEKKDLGPVFDPDTGEAPMDARKAAAAAWKAWWAKQGGK